MTIKKEIPLSEFEFWRQARINVDLAQFTPFQWEAIEQTLKDSHPDGMSEEELNEFFQFDFAFILDWVGMDSRNYELYQTINK